MILGRTDPKHPFKCSESIVVVSEKEYTSSSRKVKASTRCVATPSCRSLLEARIYFVSFFPKIIPEKPQIPLDSLVDNLRRSRF